MASSLDDELALFEAELKALEQEQPKETAPEDDAGSKKRARDESASDAATGEPSLKKAPGAAAPPPPPAKKSGLGGGLSKPVVTETVVIRSAPKIYMAPPRPAPAKKLYDPSTAATSTTSTTTTATASSNTQPRPGVPNTVAAVEAHRGALSGFPSGVSGEYAARDTSTAAAAPRVVAQVPRFDIVSGQYLSAEEQNMVNQQQSVYEYDPNRPVTTSVQGADGSNAPGADPQGKQKKLLRLAGGEVWEDQTLADWPDNDFRLFCGDLGNEVSDELLAHSFSQYASFQRAKVVRDKYTHKSRGYGFVSFADPFDCAKALREMNGKYIGNRPVKLTKSKWQDRNIDVAKKKMKKKNRHLFT
ncbi:Rna-binding protein [Globisporangium polare]